jgi:N-acetylglucosaminyl-diphospho-decaprenol L-rhamnosyltransferase
VVAERAPDLRIGIVSWNTADLLDGCLAALPAALGDLVAEVVVVDNASTDGSADAAARHAGVEVVRNDVNVGYARAMNQALAGTGAPVLLALNPDTEPGPGSLAALHAALLAHPEAGLVVPRLTNPDGSLQRSVQRFPSLRLALAAGFLPARWQRGRLGKRFWLEGAPTHDRSGVVDWAIGAVHLVRTEALAGAAPYSERWFMYAEDVEICWRLHGAGWAVWFEAEVDVPHASNASGAQAWGWTRGRRFWAASYDFDATARGRVHARAWAAVNAAAGATHLLANRAGALAGGPAGERRRHAAAELRANFPVHARAALKGPPPV